MTFRTGETVGDYEILGVLGTGGMGRVFRVRNLISDRVEAMKIVLPDAGVEAGLAERFLREIKVHAALEHPNIAAMRTALRVEDQVVMIMELVEGASLAAVLRNGRLELPAAVNYAGQVLAALSYAHGRGVVHRDIKPANIIVMPDGVVKVTDFGIARAGGSERLTMTGMALGSLYYMSPEQIQGAAPDARSDLYSLGVTLYEMVTGVPPFRGENEYAVMHAHLTQEAPPPEAVTPALPTEISTVILRAMAKAPDQRFQSADEFRTALHLPGEAPPKSFPMRVASMAMPLAGPSRLDPEQVTRIETYLVRAVGPIAKHLVSQASRHATNIDELCRSLAEKVADAQERDTFLRSCGKALAGLPNTTGARSGPSRLSDERLDEARRKLAPFVGPLAKVLVDRAAKKARTTQEFYAALAAEIPSERERASFLSSLGG
jgi:serine/threonine-protein kinase